MRKKVLILINESIPGGGQQHVLSLASGISQKQFDLAVGSAGEGFLVDALRRAEIRHISVDMPKSFSRRGLTNVEKSIAEFKPDLVHTHGGIAGFYGRWVCRGNPSISVVHTYHGIHYFHFSNTIKRLLYSVTDRVLLRSTDWIVCVSESDRVQALAHGLANPSRSSTIHNGIDANQFSRRKIKSRGGLVVGTVGRLHRQKGQVHFLRAAARVLRTVPNTKFRIVGEGELRQELEQVVSELGIGSRVKFVGNSLEVSRELAAMDIFVLPSLWEGLPLVVLESMAASVPVIVTDLDGVREIVVDGENGLIVPVKDEVRLAEAILALIDDSKKRKRLASRGRITVVEKFSRRRMISETIGIYERLLANG